MNINIRSPNKAQFKWEKRTQSIEKFRLLASPDELKTLDQVISMIDETNALYNGEAESISDHESSSDNTTDIENDKSSIDNDNDIDKKRKTTSNVEKKPKRMKKNVDKIYLDNISDKDETEKREKTTKITTDDLSYADTLVTDDAIIKDIESNSDDSDDDISDSIDSNGVFSDGDDFIDEFDEFDDELNN